MKTYAIAAFEATLAAVPELVVAVVSGDDTAQGMKSNQSEGSSMSATGMETGEATGTVWVVADGMARPARGATVTVGGVECFVGSTMIDPAGALLRIDYVVGRPHDTSQTEPEEGFTW